MKNQDNCDSFSTLSFQPNPDTGSKNGWYKTIAPYNHYDSEGTHLFKSTSSFKKLLGDNSKNIKVEVREVSGIYGVLAAVTRDRNELFVLSGCIAANKKARGAVVTKLDAVNLKKVWEVQLIDAKKNDEWNYPGGIGVHRNGYIYVVYGYRLAKIDPRDGSVIKVTLLPTLQKPKDVAYNGFMVMPDGMIITKSVNRKNGCTADGYRAYVKCGPSDVPSTFAIVDPDMMELVHHIHGTEMMGSRICTGACEGNQYVYAAGLKHLHRYIYKNKKLKLDESWGPVSYLEGKQQNGSAPAILGDFVVLNTNGIPSMYPLSVVAVSQLDDRIIHKIMPFPDKYRSFNPCKIAVDKIHKRVYVVDGMAGRIAGINFDEEKGFSLAWQDNQVSYGFMNLIGENDERVLISTAVVHSFFMAVLKNLIYPVFKAIVYLFKKEKMIWRDATTGNKLAESVPLDRGGFITTPGFDGVVYFPTTFAGKLFELRPKIEGN